MKKANDIFLDIYPVVDLHGQDRQSASVITNDFIHENVLLGNKIICIIHGKGNYIVKASVYDTLKKNKNVLDYKTDNFNDGLTIVRLNLDK